MYTEDRKSFRKEIFSKLEEQFQSGRTPEDDLFYCHSSEDKIVLSHALFWVMTRNLRGKVTKEKFFLLLRQLEEEMLEAYLTESEDFKDWKIPTNHANLSEKDTKHEMLKDFDSPFDINVDLYK